MTDEQTIRAELLRVSAKRGKPAEIAAALSIRPSTVKRWIDGGQIPPPMLILLDLYFFGTIPFEIANEKLLHGVLDFTEDQWKVISILAFRGTTTPGKWIADKVRWMLAGDEDARKEQSAIEATRRNGRAHFEIVNPPAKVADATEGTGTN